MNKQAAYTEEQIANFMGALEIGREPEGAADFWVLMAHSPYNRHGCDMDDAAAWVAQLTPDQAAAILLDHAQGQEMEAAASDYCWTCGNEGGCPDCGRPACSTCGGVGSVPVRCEGCDGRGYYEGGMCECCGGMGTDYMPCPACSAQPLV